VAYMRMATELERIGDHASDIARCVCWSGRMARCSPCGWMSG
jgi:phosphate uptake regulator